MKTLFTICAVALASSAIFSASTASAEVLAAATKDTQNSRIEPYTCGLQVGKSLVELANSTVKEDVQNISEDIFNFIASSHLAETSRTPGERKMAARAASVQYQSIMYALGKISEVNKQAASDIEKACKLSSP